MKKDFEASIWVGIGLFIAGILLAILAISFNKINDKVFMEFLNVLNINKKIYIENIQDLDITQYTEELEKSPFNDNEIEMLTEVRLINNRLENKIFTLEEAILDIEYAFKLLKHGYGAYQFFGGDKVFNEKKDEIISELLAIDNIKLDNIRKLLFDKLKFINDAHFSVAEFPINSDKSKVYAYNDELIFKKDYKGFLTTIDNEKYYLKTINEGSIEDYLKNTITEKGELAYAIGLLINNVNNTPILKLRLINEKEDKEIEKEITLKKDITSNKNSNIAFKKEDIDGIPILKLMKMSNHNNLSDTSLDDFVESGKVLSKEEILIIDLRGNRGGSDLYPLSWFINYFGEEPNRYRTVAKKEGAISLYAAKSYYDYYRINDEGLNYVVNRIENNDYGYWNVKSLEGKQIKNDNLVFVLTDKLIASSGETLVSYLRNVENVVFVGTNTEGCTLTPNVYSYFLPNTNISLSFGMGVVFMENRIDLEGVGFEPDIWINSSDALDATIRLINNYKLNKK